jgi:hypothetical protein
MTNKSNPEVTSGTYTLDMLEEIGLKKRKKKPILAIHLRNPYA